jgi:RimJ/RimL family protein N-acetyltransferase
MRPREGPARVPERAAPAGILIRALTPADAPVYREVRLEGLRLHPDAFTSSYEDEVQLTDAAFRQRIPDVPPDVIFDAFLAGDAGTSVLVGVVGFRANSRQKQLHRAEVWGMYVRQAARGRGLAAALLARVIEHARGFPAIERIHLTVEAGNQPARAVYQAAGFLPFGIDRHMVKLGPGQYYDAEMRVLVLSGDP